MAGISTPSSGRRGTRAQGGRGHAIGRLDLALIGPLWACAREGTGSGRGDWSHVPREEGLRCIYVTGDEGSCIYRLRHIH